MSSILAITRVYWTRMPTCRGGATQTTLRRAELAQVTESAQVLAGESKPCIQRMDRRWHVTVERARGGVPVPTGRSGVGILRSVPVPNVYCVCGWCSPCKRGGARRNVVTPR